MGEVSRGNCRIRCLLLGPAATGGPFCSWQMVEMPELTMQAHLKALCLGHIHRHSTYSHTQWGRGKFSTFPSEGCNKATWQKTYV